MEKDKVVDYLDSSEVLASLPRNARKLLRLR